MISSRPQKKSHRWKRVIDRFPIVGTISALLLWTGCEVPRQESTEPVVTPMAAPAAPTVADVKTVPVLCLAARDLKKQGLNDLDPQAVAAYRKAGFDLHFGYYEEATAESLAQYPVVVGMMPMLYPGTRVLDDRLGPVLEAYIKNGGGFLLLPAPSYYGVQDYPLHINPWLAPFGAELLSEQPRDPAHQQVINRVLGYRYLGTRNLTPHPAMRGIEQVWLPIDFADSFLATHTMNVDTNWLVLVRGETSCLTRPYLDQCSGLSTVGAYSSAPPFLAVRDWGDGRIGLFATSSQYFFFDAYHPAYADGFTMQEGGLRLVAQVMNYLAEHAPPATVPGAAAAERKRVAGNVPILDGKDAWLRYAQEQFKPAGFEVAGYVDCGSVSDLPFTPERGYGYVGQEAWLIRWSWSEIFHPTAANSRGFDRKPLRYRFSGLDPRRRYQLGVLLWAGQPEAARDVQVKAGGQALGEALAQPALADAEGPRFQCLEIPASGISSAGMTEITFEVAPGGLGSFASLGELWLFAEGTHAALAPSVLRATYESPSEERHEVLQDTHLYRGLIGARSTLSGGSSSVAELCAAAREAGYDYLAFTEEALLMGADGLARLQEACRAESSAAFRALAGVSFRGRYAHEKERRPDAPYSWGEVGGYTFQPLQRLPEAGDYDNAYTLFWKFFGGELGGSRPATPTFARPATSAIPPWFTRFWRGFDVLTLDAAGQVTEDARALYTDLLSSCYGPHPRVSAVLETPDAVRAAAASGWATYINAPSLDEVDAFHYDAWIGNGPVIEKFSASFDYARDAGVGEGVLFLDQVWVQMHVNVRSTTDIERVTIYSDQVPLRSWHPGGTTLDVQESILAARNHELWLHVRTRDGREAISGAISLHDTRFSMSMCGDNQNSICNLSRLPAQFTRDDRQLFLAHSYWHTGEAYGQLGAMRDARNLVPRVIETGIIQPVKRFIPTPLLHFADGQREDHLFSEMRVTGASRDFNTVTYTFDPPGARTRAVVTLTSFRPGMEGDTVVAVESVLTTLADLDVQKIEHVRLGMQSNLAANRRYTWLGGEGLMTGDFIYDQPMGVVTGHLAAAGGVMLWPSDMGSLLVIPMDGQAYDAHVERFDKGNARESVAIASSPGRLSRGTTISNRFAVVLHQGVVDSPAALTRLRDAYTRLDKHIVNVEKGELLQASYPLRFALQEDVVALLVDTQGRNDPLPLVVEGLRSHASVLVAVNGDLQLAETLDTSVYLTLPAGLVKQRVIIGQPLRTDARALRLEWAGLHAEGIRFHVHNPTDHPVAFRVRSNPGLPIPAVDGEWSLKPGESAWLWGRGAVFVQESSTNQVRAGKE